MSARYDASCGAATLRTRSRVGFTLVELLVVIVIVGVVATVSSIAFRPATAPASDDVRESLRRARRASLAQARPVLIRVHVAGGNRNAWALPDGSVVAEDSLPADRLTGVVRP